MNNIAILVKLNVLLRRSRIGGLISVKFSKIAGVVAA
jgi:hypothetical protein